jgi:hypothetical protein
VRGLHLIWLASFAGFTATDVLYLGTIGHVVGIGTILGLKVGHAFNEMHLTLSPVSNKVPQCILEYMTLLLTIALFEHTIAP